MQQTLLSNRTLLIAATTMDPRIDDRIATCAGNPHKLATPTTKEVVNDAAHIITQINRTPRHVSQTGRGISTPGNCNIAVRPPPRITSQF